MASPTAEYDQYAAQQHEQVTMPGRIKIAQVEAKRDIKIARAKSDSYLTYKWGLAVVGCVTTLIVCVTYGSTRPPGPADQIKEQNRQSKFELCMAVEKDIDKCENI